MVKPVFFGLLAFFVILALFAIVIGSHTPAGAMAVGEPGWREQHDQLIAISTVKLLTVAGWFVSSLCGGLVAGLLAGGRCLRASAYLGGIIILLWAVPSSIILGAAIGWVHMASIAAVIVGSTTGGVLARYFRKA
ncbi:hypothetical protein [Pseudomonas sp. efr-133-TYG-5]|jgi:hypothetical protein|uniref:hypothetical protein n=1 Tax=Pseudomonas sp. efr-133-TYG-5 TaxID=3040310 RepID=UPI0025546464|nr:hypothetical protein [Pseudomonas sp. efr-133-TYG-5]